jgi:hypothetical protein
LIAPSGRHHAWYGRTFAKALDKAEKDIRKWLDLHEKYLNGEEPDEYYI